MNQVAAIFEMDEERDRKTYIALDLKSTGNLREQAQWLLDHPRYTQRTVAGWVGCDHTRIFYLRKWAARGFEGSPFGKSNKPDSRQTGHGGAARHQGPLETNENSETGEGAATEIADPETVEDNALYTIQRINEHARIFKKLFKASSFDREAKERISTAIDRLIEKWRSTQATLTKGSHHGQSKI